MERNYELPIEVDTVTGKDTKDNEVIIKVEDLIGEKGALLRNANVFKISPSRKAELIVFENLFEQLHASSKYKKEYKNKNLRVLYNRIIASIENDTFLQSKYDPLFISIHNCIPFHIDNFRKNIKFDSFKLEDDFATLCLCLMNYPSFTDRRLIIPEGSDIRKVMSDMKEYMDNKRYELASKTYTKESLAEEVRSQIEDVPK